ncbi:MAG: type II toxin-antitoxin system CcdA family antitoxin [Myxococcales bacterium]|nr:type II toxin-antitoxin system CcdA family antitoxin [Myxococcales bacterium]
MPRSLPRKAPTNVSVREDYVRRAKALKLNLSELLERALEVAIREAEREVWLKENEAAIAQYNEQVARRGVFSQARRRF